MIFSIGKLYQVKEKFLSILDSPNSGKFCWLEQGDVVLYLGVDFWKVNGWSIPSKKFFHKNKIVYDSKLPRDNPADYFIECSNDKE